MLRSNLVQASRLGAMTIGLLMLACLGDAQPAKEKPKTDTAGDPLPPGALARMGTLRWRHSEAVSFVAFTPDGKAVLTAANDSTIRLWDRETGKEIRRFDVPAPAQQPGGRLIAVGWNSFGRGASKIALSPDGKSLALVHTNNSVQLFDVANGKKVHENKLAGVAVNSIFFAPDSKSFATRTYNRITTLFKTATGEEIRQLKGKQPNAGGIRVINGQIVSADGFAFSHDGKHVASAEMEAKVENNMQVATIYITVSETETGKEVRKIDVTGGVSSIAYSPDGKILAFGNGNSVHLRDAGTGKEIRTIDNGAPMSSIVFAPDSKTIAVKRRDSIIRLYETDTGKHTHEFGTSTAQPGANIAFIGAGQPEVRDFSFSPDSKTLALGGALMVRFYNVATGKEIADGGAPAGHRGAVSTVAVSPDGKTLLSRGADNVIRRWDAADGKELGHFAEPKGTIGAAFAADGKTVALANTDGTIRIHAVADGKELHSLKGHQNGTAALAFSPNGKVLASRGSADNTVRLFDADKGRELTQITLPGANAGGGFIARPGSYFGGNGMALAFSADGQTLAANYNATAIRNFGGGQPQPANPDNAIYQWDVRTGKQIRKITLPGNRIVVNLAFSPDGRVLAAENSDQTLSLWEIASGRERAVLGTPPGPAQPNQPVFIGGGGFGVANRLGGTLTAATVAFSPDGALLATRNVDHSVRVWEVAQAKEVGTFKGHDAAVNALAFAPDGKRLASASADTTLLVWDLTQLKRTPKAAAVELSAKEVEKLWVDLVHDDAGKASAAIHKLATAPKSASAYLSERLHPAVPPDVKKIDQWIHDLDSPTFAKRKMATEELERLGELAVPALRKLLDGQPTPEVRRRVEPLLEKLTTGVLSMEQIRTVRAIEALENMGGADARKLLERLANGAPGALSTRHAQAAFYRHGVPY